MEKFDLEHQYQLYLERVDLKEDEMSTVQRKETKRAFMGACEQMLSLLRRDLIELDDSLMMATMHAMICQAHDYFKD